MKYLIIAMLVVMTGCSSAKLECKDSCNVTKDVDGKTTISCTACSLEVNGKEELLNINIPSLPNK